MSGSGSTWVLFFKFFRCHKVKTSYAMVSWTFKLVCTNVRTSCYTTFGLGGAAVANC